MSKRKKGREGDAPGAPGGPRFTAGMLVADAVDADPKVKDVLLGFGLPCSECIVAFHESLEDGCGPLGLRVDDVLSRLNALD